MTSVIAEPRRPETWGHHRRWRDLTVGERRFVVAGTALDTALKVAMLVDLRRRPGEQVRGPTWAWASAALINSAGVIPAAYFAVGVTRSGRHGLRPQLPDHRQPRRHDS
ncbi:hypothetical protein [Cryptosporangium arvum]|uniref:DUF5652 domain-containing protein n=1 Tax=Cryptosporangium arvum DSM 44712 TaxID=927661 RepID=A0A011AKG8_9ACTN|nr:hypothetical protein [Cryptosporangium arvum]EXG82466.1 hypothetical protein CryarDRAFT_3654 [Cryptosporangium arvum DSM 44712]